MIVIKGKELQEFRPQIRYQDGQDITLQAIQSLLQGEAQQAGIPIAFRLDQVRGGLFGGAEGLSGSVPSGTSKRLFFSGCPH